jgi:hypothetical protein
MFCRVGRGGESLVWSDTTHNRAIGFGVPTSWHGRREGQMTSVDVPRHAVAATYVASSGSLFYNEL